MYHSGLGLVFELNSTCICPRAWHKSAADCQMSILCLSQLVLARNNDGTL